MKKIHLMILMTKKNIRRNFNKKNSNKINFLINLFMNKI